MTYWFDAVPFVYPLKWFGVEEYWWRTQPGAYVAHVYVIRRAFVGSAYWTILPFYLSVCGPECCRTCRDQCICASRKCACFVFLNWESIAGDWKLLEKKFTTQATVAISVSSRIQPCARKLSWWLLRARYWIPLSGLGMSRILCNA